MAEWVKAEESLVSTNSYDTFGQLAESEVEAKSSPLAKIASVLVPEPDGGKV